MASRAVEKSMEVGRKMDMQSCLLQPLKNHILGSQCSLPIFNALHQVQKRPLAQTRLQGH